MRKFTNNAFLTRQVSYTQHSMIFLRFYITEHNEFMRREDSQLLKGKMGVEQKQMITFLLLVVSIKSEISLDLSADISI